MTRATILRRAAIAALALAVTAGTSVPAANAGATPAAGPGGAFERQAVERSGNLVEVHDNWGHGRRHWRHHNRQHRKHWDHHRRHYDSYYYDRPVVVERYRYVEPYYYNPFDSLFGALVFNFRFDGDGHRHHRGDGHRRHRD